MEYKAPDGYIIEKSLTDVKVAAGEITDVTITNEEIKETLPPARIKIIKRAEGTGFLLSGAVFYVFDAMDNKKVTELTTGSDGTALSVELPEGAYYLVEQKAPVGYILNSDRIYFSLNIGETKEMTVTNAPEIIAGTPNSHVKIVKTMEGLGVRLSGAVFGLYRQGTDEKVAELTTDAEGTVISAALHAGNYYLLELQAPSGFKLNTNKIHFTLNAGETKEITVYNAPKENEVPEGNLFLTKKAEFTGMPLPDAVFGIYNAGTNAKIDEITTDAEGTAVYALPEGSYYLLEVQAPTGFALETSQIPFVITDGNTIKVDVTNMTEKGGVRLIARDAIGTALEDAVFGLYNANDVKFAELTTGRDGMALYNLPAGVYYVKAIKPPRGYSHNDEAYSFYVTTGQTVDVLAIMQRINIPKTGEMFPWPSYAVSFCCLSVYW